MYKKTYVNASPVFFTGQMVLQTVLTGCRMSEVKITNQRVVKVTVHAAEMLQNFIAQLKQYGKVKNRHFTVLSDMDKKNTIHRAKKISLVSLNIEVKRGASNHL
jgi:hypothetical protein